MAAPKTYRNFAADHPNQEIGGYRSWTLNQNVRTPFDMLWIHNANTPSPPPQFVMPHAEPSIGIHRFFAADGSIEDVRLVVCGAYSRARPYGAPPRSQLIAVRLKPELADDFLSVSPGDYADLTPVSADEKILSAFDAARRAGERKPATAVGAALISVLERFAGKFSPAGERSEQIAARILRRTDGRPSISKLARRLGVNERTLRRRFTARLGVSPKAYARRLRVTAALLRAEESLSPNWAEIAHDFGYHDQSHMIADFRLHTDMTPSETFIFRREVSGFSNTAG